MNAHQLDNDSDDEWPPGFMDDENDDGNENLDEEPEEDAIITYNGEAEYEGDSDEEENSVVSSFIL